MRKIHAIFLGIALLVLGNVQAQTRQVKGTVTDSTGNPLSNVSVQVRNTRTGAKTDESGSFTIQVPAGNPNLVISNVGYETQELNVANRSQVNISLRIGRQTVLQDVVVTALGITRNRRTLGYATQTVKNEDIADKGDQSLLNALQGKIAGAEITGSSGSAGASTNILLRGISSFSGNNQPLFVVDGTPISNDVDQGTIGLYSDQTANRAMDLNINNIESVNILQGPAAAALYGSRAAHGAIVVTTKRGAGKKGAVNVTFNTAYTSQKIYGFPELQNTYGQGANGTFSAISTFSYGPAFGSKPTIANGLIVAPNTTPFVNGVRYAPGDVVAYQPFPDNLASYFRTGSVWENNLVINAGDAKNNYGFAVGNSTQKGILPTSSFNRTNLQFSASSYLTDKLYVKGIATYYNTLQNGVTQGSNGSYSSIARLYTTPRSIDMDYYREHFTTPNGYNNWFIPNVYSTLLQDSTSAADNPYFAANRNPIKSNLTRLIGSVTLGYDINSWLSVNYRVGVDTYTDRRKRTTAIGSTQAVRSTYTGTPGTATGGIMDETYYRSEINGDFIISAKKNDLFLKGLNATLLLGQNVNQRKYQSVSEIGYNLTVPGYYNITNATNLALSNEYNSTRRLVGYYGQLSLGFKNYLFLELTGRADESSTLPINKNTYFYPSGSISYVLSDALHIQSDFLSFAKLRTSYARVGNDAAPYQLQSVYQSTSFGNNVSFYTFPYGSVAGFGVSSVIANPNLKPEFTKSYEAGANVGLFKNKISVDFTYYNQVSKDQIVSVAVPGSSGYQTQTINIGELTNKGVEITLSATPVRTRDFTWGVSGNFSRNRNKVTAIAPGVNSYGITGVTSFSGNIPSIVLGQPYGVIVGSKFLTNANGDRLVDSTTGQYAGYVANQVVANPNRDWVAGLTNTFNYKNFTFSFLLDFKKGGDIESFTIATLRSNGSLKETGVDRDLPKILPGVIDAGNGKYIPNFIQIPAQTYWNAGFGASTGSSTSNEFAVFDATTFRVREVSISYDILPNTANTKLFKSIRFTIYGRNLYYYAPNCPIDPEVNTQGAGNVRGLELQSAPNTRNIGASLRVNF
jgi:TonB-linked SusC/RagA family outer membrane protein